MFARTALLLLSVCLGLSAHNSIVDALRPAVSNRRGFVGQLVAGTAGAAVIATTTAAGGAAWAADDDITKAYGAKKVYTKDAASGSAVVKPEKQPDASASLLDKMGIGDVTGAKSGSSTGLTSRTSNSGMKTVFGSA